MLKLEQTVKRYNMLPPGTRVLCALSSGADSACLTAALCELSKKLQITVAAAHFSHGIRPHAAEYELSLAAKLCEKYGIRLFAGSGDTLAFAAMNRVGAEDAARALRYGFLHRALKEWGGERIATAHNLSDQAETVLLNLARGAGGTGLRGIPPVRGAIVRPLIETPRADIESFLAERDIVFAVDETNADASYSRNRVRAHILPELEKINPAAVRNIARSAGIAYENDILIDSLASDILSSAEPAAGGLSLSCSRVTSAPRPVAARALMKAAHAAGVETQLTSRHIEALLALCRSGGPSGGVSLPGGTASRVYGLLVITKGEAGLKTPPPALLAQGGSVTWGAWNIECSDEAVPGAFAFGKCDITFPITVRGRSGGDTIRVRGNTKTVKKYMIERKIPQKYRDNLPVLCDNKGVLCVADLIADSVRVMQPGIRGRAVHIICRRI